MIHGLSLLLLVVAAQAGYSQEYGNSSFGVRVGNYTGFTIKHFLNNQAAIDGIVTSRFNGFNITGLYEIHKPFFNVPDFHWYYGGGPTLALGVEKERSGNGTKVSTIAGLNGVVGATYPVRNAPLNFALEWKPIYFFAHNGEWGQEFALSIRFAMKHER